ncbi:MAG: SDR family oxidoreductase [Deltaproteobacteria bacterium]|nr:SDR family oxidoreductase [Deltaproteobacteria bacterium]
MAMGRGSVVITGASTGIGRACAQQLARAGFRVFAGVRRAEDGEALRQAAAGEVVPLMLDVTRAESVRAAADTVTAAVGDAGLAGLVNNAGIVVAGPLEFLPVEKLRWQLEVNVVGLLAVTQAFLPLIRKARGRIVHMGSVSGRMASPFTGPYAASKFAVEALSDAMRLELAPWGIKVILVEPGAIATPIWEKSGRHADELEAALPPAAATLYGETTRRVREAVAAIQRRAAPVETVTAVVEDALTDDEPRTRYLVGNDARAQAALAWLVPDRARDALLTRLLRLPRGA